MPGKILSQARDSPSSFKEGVGDEAKFLEFQGHALTLHCRQMI
jgi:hypothetical protein